MPDRRWAAFVLAGAVFALDRLTKHLVDIHVSLYDSFKVIPGFFDIVHSTNRGAAFGLFNDVASGWRAQALPVVVALAVVAVSVVLWRSKGAETRQLIGLGLILGGAAGNLFDRLAWGRVTDFLLFYIGQYQWPAFNVADSGVVIGSFLVAFDALFPRRKPNVP